MVGHATVDLRQPGVVTKEVVSTSFSFYDAEEARRISVKRISNPVLFDALNNPVQDGLYDPALGPIDAHGSCATCRLGAMHCPGHFGHIELAVPVYNPLTFSTVVRLLRSMCLHCGHFKMAADRVARFAERLRLIREGNLQAAASISLGGVSKATREELNEIEREVDEGTGVDDMDVSAVSRVVPEIHRRARFGARGEPRVRWTAHANAEARDLLKLFLGSVPVHCENCGCANPKIAPEGANKIYRAGLNGKQREQNAAVGVDLEGELATLGSDDGSSGDRNEDGVDLAGQELTPDEGAADPSGSDARRRRRRKKKKREDDADDDDEGSESDASGSESSDVEVDLTAPDARGGDAGSSAPARRRVYVTPIEARALLKKLWGVEYDFCSMVWVAEAPNRGRRPSPRAGASAAPALPVRRSDPSRFFMQTVLVTPCRLRPPSRMGDMLFEHPQNTHLNAIIQANLTLAELFRKPPTVPEPPEARAQRAVRAWLSLQGGVNKLIDSSKAEGGEAAGAGIRQQLEKKQGLFRMNMMGKRVNYAARSVIMPDPYIRTSEIGVPPVFARKLTFPENVTAHNVELMRRLVENGPETHPGANAIEDERGRVIHLDRFTAEKRAAIAKTLLATPVTLTGAASAAAAGIPGGEEKEEEKNAPGAAAPTDDASLARGGARKAALAGGDGALPRPLAKRVYRHLRDGDVLLVNRQPTLHKPGIMAHTARVLRGQRTIRMHYANCSTYNADFDGDEMNLHFPQDHLGRAEAYEIVRADQQFTVPTDGKPLRGLIQDHVCAGVLLTKRDTFLTRGAFQQLLYLALVDFAGEGAGGGAAAGSSLRTPPPAIIKPAPLWTGKQVLTAVLEHVTRGRAPMTVEHGTKVPANYWGGEGSGEGELVVRRDYVCAGVLDKNVFGKFGLVHAIKELHGGVLAGDFISACSRLLTAFLQKYGMTCGMDDLLLRPEVEAGRRDQLAKSEKACRGAAATFAEADENAPDVALREQIATRLREREGAEATLDMRSSGALNKVTSAVVGQCLPHGTKKPFPKNCLSLMTQSGAKGSMVNFSQIAACLGQQELEGRRVPRMTSGKTLPCFRPHDVGPRAGGYVQDRFFSGLRPQEYFFHCMAGREGLVDTAVKTSRSGYLQRCLVKNLEALRVHYDHTVRDCDGAIVQFHYGDDAVDVTKGGYAEKFAFLAQNPELVRANLDEATREGVAEGKLKRDDDDDDDDDASRPTATGFGAGLPRMATRPAGSTLGALPERFSEKLDAFLAGTHPGYFADDVVANASEPPPRDEKGKGKKKASKRAKPPPSSAPNPSASSLARAAGMSRGEFSRLMNLRYLSSLAAPGEAVGCVAAQSVGEPSTQMTLNTFHFAGRGEANVTLGIPRLRELLMAAAKKLATPVMTLPLRPEARNEETAKALARKLRRVRLAELVKTLTAEESACGRSHGGRGELARVYAIEVTLRGGANDSDSDDESPMDDSDDSDDDDDDSDPAAGGGKVTFARAARAFRRDFARKLFGEVRLELRRRGASGGRIHAGREEGARTGAAASSGAPRDGDGDDDVDDLAAATRASAAKTRAANAEEGEDADGEDDGDEDDDEEGAKTEDRRGARGDDGEGYADADGEAEKGRKRRKEDAADADRVETVKTEGVAKDDDDDGSDDSDDSASDDESDDSDPRGPGSKSPKSSKRTNPAAGSGGSGPRSSRGGALESLEEVLESVACDPVARTCRLTLSLPLDAPRLLMLELAERCAASCVVRSVPGIDKTFVVGKPASEDPAGLHPLSVQTDGVYFPAAWDNDDVVDCAAVRTNDVFAALQTYGVEAARETLVAEVKGVFGVYGIGVDARHLSLIGDFMTQHGDYRPCSRAGMETCVSPLLKMSFETAAAFLVDATLKGSEDTLESPSAKLVLGQVVEMGTGSFGLRYDMKKADKLKSEMEADKRAF